MLGIVIIAVGGLPVYLFPKTNRFGPWIATTTMLLGNVLILPAAFAGLGTQIHDTAKIGGFTLTLDSLAAFFILIFGFISLLASIYAQGYLRRYQDDGSDIRVNLLLLNILAASMIVVTLVNETIPFLFVWEIMTLSSFLLVIYDHRQPESLRAGVKYLVSMHVSFLFLLAGFVIASTEAGSASFQGIAGYFSKHPESSWPIVLLLFLGFSIKAGFVPFHYWLPEAHPAAPTHVSAVMSGVMIKTGIFGILRVLVIFPIRSVSFSAVFLVLAAVSGLYGVMYALSQHDLKKLLAYHSVENIGIIGLGIGMGMLGQATGNPLMAFLGYAGALLHVAGHAIFKSLLFFAAGSVYRHAHTRDIERLGGLHRNAPWTAGAFLIGSLAICGLPPFNGFISEYLIFASLFTGVKTAAVSVALLGLTGIIALALIGGLALACFTKAFGVMFLGEPRLPLPEKTREAPAMLIPMALLAVATLLVGVFPQAFVGFLAAPVRSIIGRLPFSADRLIVPASRISLVCLIFLGIAAGLAIMRRLLLSGRSLSRAVTWGCGYHGVTPRMQYTGSSFADGILNLFGRMLKKDRHLSKPQGLFPAQGDLKTHTSDLFDFYFLQPLLGLLAHVFRRFRWIQHGDLQNYLWYGLAFLLVIIIVACGGK